MRATPNRKVITMPGKPTVAGNALGIRSGGSVKALEAIYDAGGLSPFEERMFDIAAYELRRGNGGTAHYILWHLARAAGVPLLRRPALRRERFPCLGRSKP